MAGLTEPKIDAATLAAAKRQLLSTWGKTGGKSTSDDKKAAAKRNIKKAQMAARQLARKKSKTRGI